MSRRVKDPLLERYLAGDLPAEAKARVEETLASSEGDRQRLEELRADSAAFLFKHPPGAFAAKVRSRRSRLFWLSALLAPLAVAAVALLLVLPGEDAYTTKGSLVLVLHRKTDTGSEPLSHGAEVKPGDRLRFEVRAGGAGYVAVLGRDARGQVSVYLPFDGREAVPYDPKAPMLDQAIELDGTLGQEELFAFYSPQPFALAPVREALRKNQTPRRLNVTSVTVTKR
ncbi:MAG: hypothetical protein ACOZIN_22700 [Myxococcota bacterium]